MVFQCSFTIRTARSRTSGETLIKVPVLLMAPSSQTSEPPANPGRVGPNRNTNMGQDMGPAFRDMKKGKPDQGLAFL
jgi:hypothetical protein